MGNAQLDRLDAIAAKPAQTRRDLCGVLSTGERLYVALASSDFELLKRLDYTIPQAIARIGADWTNELVKRWQYA